MPGAHAVTGVTGVTVTICAGRPCCDWCDCVTVTICAGRLCCDWCDGCDCDHLCRAHAVTAQAQGVEEAGCDSAKFLQLRKEERSSFFDYIQLIIEQTI